METQQFKISADESLINWIGRKVTGTHNGTIMIKEGSLSFDKGILSSGEFVIDMTSIDILDITDPALNAQFATHLHSDDFFNSHQYPVSTLKMTSAEPRGSGPYRMDALLTIKGITHPVSFDADIATSEEEVKATAKLTVDRTKFAIKYRSGNFFKDLGDNLIFNNFDVHVQVTAKALVAIPAL
jgi:polyisoprenoid-binding protein YceI